MEASTTIKTLLANKIEVPRYQRAYSWDTPVDGSARKTHTDVFLADLEEHSRSNAGSPYYFGHFLFEENGSSFNVIDGQQRLTTIVIFLSALFAKLRMLRKLSNDEEVCYEDMVKRRGSVHFATVGYDNVLFRDYVIDNTKTDHNNIETVSGLRIVAAFDYFRSQLSNKSDQYLTKMLDTIGKANCTTHKVRSESEAIQMFIFQNNRGKTPSNLEIVKAQFMYCLHLHAGDDKEDIMKLVKDRFETIYKAIAKIEYRMNEDEVLVYTLRVHFNSLWEGNAQERINSELGKEKPVEFVVNFTRALSLSFEFLSAFFGKDEKGSFAIHSLIVLGGIGVALPFIIKAYKYDVSCEDRDALCGALENLVLREHLIGTRADVRSRINGSFQRFDERNRSVMPIIKLIDSLKSATDWWWAYWNDEKLNASLQGAIEHRIAKYLLWKYENHLTGSRGKAGYLPMRFEQISRPELEHIAPTEEPKKRPHGYDEYNEEFCSQYIDCLGNYLLLSKSHNASIHNDPFPVKHRDYQYLEQQREVRDMVPDPEQGIWGKVLIKRRKEKIVRFVMENS